jgi:threonine dehydratase
MQVEAEAFGTPGPLSLKLEFLQHTGSFKPRGAFTTLLSERAPAAGVVAASGGNHGAAVAYAARQLGLRARIFVPSTSSPVKIARIREAGAEIVIEGVGYADALALSEAYRTESGALAVHAYDAPATISGQGTVGLEWDEQARLDTVLIAVGGGGLVAGIAAWFQGRVRVVGVEPEGAPTLHAALAAGAPVDVAVSSIAADSLGARRTGPHILEIATRYVDRVALVSDAAIREAQRLLWARLRIAAEPGGAAALAALLSGAYRPAAGERVGVLLCGGNVDLADLAMLVRDGALQRTTTPSA